MRADGIGRQDENHGNRTVQLFESDRSSDRHRHDHIDLAVHQLLSKLMKFCGLFRRVPMQKFGCTSVDVTEIAERLHQHGKVFAFLLLACGVPKDPHAWYLPAALRATGGDRQRKSGAQQLDEASAFHCLPFPFPIVVRDGRSRPPLDNPTPQPRRREARRRRGLGPGPCRPGHLRCTHHQYGNRRREPPTPSKPPTPAHGS